MERRERRGGGTKSTKAEKRGRKVGSGVREREREGGKWVGEKRANEERRRKRARLKCLIFLLFLVPISPALAAAAAEDPSGRSNYLSFQSRREDPRLFPPPWAPPFLRYFTASADSTFPLPHFFFSWGVSSLFPATHFRPFALLLGAWKGEKRNEHRLPSSTANSLVAPSRTHLYSCYAFLNR